MRVKVKKLSSFWEKTKGLIFSEGDSPVYLETRFGIHTFFLKNPIDVVVLDHEYVVRKIQKNISPGKIFLWNPKYFRVIEFPLKASLPKGIRKGMTLSIESSVK